MEPRLQHSFKSTDLRRSACSLAFCCFHYCSRHSAIALRQRLRSCNLKYRETCGDRSLSPDSARANMPWLGLPAAVPSAPHCGWKPQPRQNYDGPVDGNMPRCTSGILFCRPSFYLRRIARRHYSYYQPRHTTRLSNSVSSRNIVAGTSKMAKLRWIEVRLA